MKIHASEFAALESVQSGRRVFVHGAAATPNRLLDGLLGHADRLRGVELVHLHTIGPARYADPEYKDSFRVSAFFIGPNLRRKLSPGRVDYLPCFLSEIPALFRT